MRLPLKIALALAAAAGLALAGGPGDAQNPPAHPIPYPVLHPVAQSAEHGLSHTAAQHAVSRPLAAPPSPAATAPMRPGARLAPGTPIPPVELESLVDGVVREAMARDHIAGVSVAVVQSGQVVLKKGYGFAGPGRAVDPDRTLFRLGSISKTFTWIALMKEVEANRIRLTAPVNLFLPEKLQVKDQGFKRPILVRDLMTHSAGFEDRALGQLFEKDPARVRPLADYLRQERPRRVREAGTTPVYSNYGAGLAGAAVTYVNGHPYQDIVDAEIMRPLGLARTTFREPYPARQDLPAPMPAALAADVSAAYHAAGGVLSPQPFEYITQIAPAGAASSTAGDMARYMLMILNGGQLDGVTIYNPDTAKGFRTTLLAAAPGVNGWDDGFMEFSLPGDFRGQGHLGDTLWFHSAMVTVPDLNLGVFATANTDTGAELVERLPDQIVARFYGPAETFPLAGSAELVSDRATYEGDYLTELRPYGGLEKFVYLLIGQAKVRVTEDGRLTTSDGAAAQVWTPDGPAGHFRQADGPRTTAFEISDGIATRWFPPSGETVFDRIGPLQQIPTLILVAVLTALTSIATLIGLFTRDRREFRQTPMQARASLMQTTISILWLVAFASFGVWAVGAVGDQAGVMYGWPEPSLLVASACALVAAVLTLLTVAVAPVIWRGGRRVDSWTGWRKLRFTASTVVFAACAVLLALWGALEPWSG